MMTMSISRVWVRMRRVAASLRGDSSGVAATEFAVIVPLMLVLFFGTVEFSSGVAVDRKVTMIARTLSDLTSQAPPPTATTPYSIVNDAYLQNVFTASISILTPYASTPVNTTISEIYVDTNKVAKIQWSKAATVATGAQQATLATSSRNAGDVVTNLVPAALLVKQTYLLFSEVSYRYTPTIGYVMSASGVVLGDVAYTRPRQVTCVIYNNQPVTPPTLCPQT
jgi:Flp pilus assembly protein TadG